MDNEAKFAFFDFEASSLGRDSYPIEIGWAFPDTGESRSYLIRPIEAWTDWDPAAAVIHNIPRQELVMRGVEPRQVVETFLEAVKGRILVSDAPSYEAFWLRRLFDAAQTAQERFQKLSIANFNLLILDTTDRFFAGTPLTAMEQARRQEKFLLSLPDMAAKTVPKTHRAGDDARNMMEIFRLAQLGPEVVPAN